MANEKIQQALSSRLDASRIPAHVAIIMDGNGRWARKRAMPRLFGHNQGYRTLRNVVNDAADLGIKALTVYGFSSENWKRSKTEVDGLMRLIEQAAREQVRNLNDNNIRMRFSGRLHELPQSLQDEIARDEALTANNTRLTLNLCINYGGRAEILDAARRLVDLAAQGKLCACDVSEETFSQGLYASDLPDPDLLIRTAGELRVSNYLLWQIAYSEIWVTPTLWPDFGTDQLIDALVAYQARERKFGGVPASA